MDPSQPFPTSGSSSRSSTELQAPPSAQLEVRQDSHKRKKPHCSQRPSSQSRQHPTEPRIIYETPPKVIHTNPKDFKAIVQRLTGWDGRASSSHAASTSTSTSSSSQVVHNKRGAASSSNAGRLMDKSPAARDVVMDDQMNASQRFLIGDRREQGQHCNLGSSSQLFGNSIGGSSSSKGLMSNNISQAARYAVMDDQMNLNQQFLIGDRREQGQHFSNLGSSSSQVFDKYNIGGSSSSNNGGLISNNDISSAALFAANMNSNQPFLIGNHREHGQHCNLRPSSSQLCDNNIGGSSSFNNGGLMMSNNNISQQAARYAVMDDQMNANQQFFIRDNREQGQHCNILGSSSSSQLMFDDNIIGGTLSSNNGVLMSNTDISQAAQYSVMDDQMNSNQRFLIGDHREQEGQQCMLGSSSSSSQLFDNNIGGSSSSDINGDLMSNRPAGRYAVMDDQMNYSNQRLLIRDHREQGHHSNLGSSSSSQLFDENIGESSSYSINGGLMSNNIYQPVAQYAVMEEQMNSNQRFLIGDSHEQGQNCMFGSSSAQLFDNNNNGLGAGSSSNGGLINISPAAAMDQIMNSSNQRVWSTGDHCQQLGSSGSDQQDHHHHHHMFLGSSSVNGGSDQFKPAAAGMTLSPGQTSMNNPNNNASPSTSFFYQAGMSPLVSDEQSNNNYINFMDTAGSSNYDWNQANNNMVAAPSNYSNLYLSDPSITSSYSNLDHFNKSGD